MTDEQSTMLEICLSSGAAWTTVRGSENHNLLAQWQENGWCEEVQSPSCMGTLVAYRFTEAGRTALAEQQP